MQILTNEIITKYNNAIPRYTSYPPANFFNEEIDNNKIIKIIQKSNSLNPQHIAIYIHIPFCKQICHFCACTNSLLENEQITNEYFNALKKEMEFILSIIDKKRKITQIHFGGGTPNSVNIKYLNQIITLLNKHLNIDKNAEIAIETNPAFLTIKYIKELKQIGINRISIGIQDFDPKILDIINRAKPKISINKIIESIQQMQFKSINIDLIYGLPRQTNKSFINNINKAIKLNPDRIVTFSYAHVPWVKPNQKLLEKYKFPNNEQKIIMLQNANEILTQNNYTNIGIDHFAKHNDELVIAKNKKQLHRNFQGYCTQKNTGQVYAFGASAITQLTNAYIQNSKNVNQYISNINNQNYAFEKAYKLNKNEIIIREVINQIMCNEYINLNQIAKKNNIQTQQLIKILNPKNELLKEMQNDNLIKIINQNEISTTKIGNYFLRNLAMAFDPKFKIQKQNMYSKTI